MSKEKKWSISRLLLWCLLILGVAFLLTHFILWIIKATRGNLNSILPSWTVWLGIALVFLSILFLILIYNSTKESRQQKTVSNPDSQDYDHLIQLAIHADNLNWNRLYYFLVFNSIMFVGWIMFYSSSNPNMENLCLKPYILFGLSLLGFMVSVLWGLFAIVRGMAFQDFYQEWARLIELNKNKEFDHIYTIQKFFAKGATIHFFDKSSHEIIHRKIPFSSQTLGARELMIAMPYLFSIAYLLLLVISCIKG